MTEEWKLRLAKRRGSAHTRKLALDFQAPLTPTLAGVMCARCGRPVDPIHNCEAFPPRTDVQQPAQQRKTGET